MKIVKRLALATIVVVMMCGSCAKGSESSAPREWAFEMEKVREIQQIGEDELLHPVEPRVADGGILYFHDFEWNRSNIIDGDTTPIDSIEIQWSGGVTVNQFPDVTEECCVGMTGNIDHDPVNLVNIDDLIVLVDYFFFYSEEPICLQEANTDGQGAIDICDLTRLVDYLFISHEPLSNCLCSPYMGQSPPGDTRAPFGYGIIPSSYTAHGAMHFSSDGSEAYWSMYRDPSTFVIIESHCEGENWTTPAPVSFTSEEGDCGPFLTADNSRLIFTSLRPKPPEIESPISFWSVDRLADGWSEPTLLDEPFASTTVAWQGSITNAGDIYFPQRQSSTAEEWDIVRSVLVGGEYQSIENLGDSVNSTTWEFAPFVSPDGGYLIFRSSRPGGYGRADLWICFAKPDGSWSEARNLGPSVNTGHDESYPSVSPDGQYLFYVSIGSSDYIYYWISTSVIEVLRPE